MGRFREKVKSSRSYLGNAWQEWDGDVSHYEWDVETPRYSFLILFALFWIAAVGTAWLLWYMILPRLAALHPLAPLVTGIVFLVVGSVVVLVSLSVILSALTNRNFLITRLALFMLVLAVKPMAKLAQRFGFSQDRVSNSFLKIHNILTRQIVRGARYDRILILLPRCLGKDVRGKLVSIAEMYRCGLYTAGGGTEALNRVKAIKPRAIVAVACERDLLAGIRDLGIHIPILAVPNIRENGPCRITDVNSDEFEKAVRYFTEPGIGPSPEDAIPSGSIPG